MNRRNWLLAISLSLLGFVGGLFFANCQPNPGYIPPLKVVGDVARVVKLEDPKQLGKLQHINYDGNNYQAMRLTDIIAAAQPVATAGQIYLVGNDGFTSSFPAEGLENSYIFFSAQNGWEAVNLKHPINSNVKMLKEIVVIAKECPPHFGITLIKPDKELFRITPGQLYKRDWLDYPYVEGQAVVENEGISYTSAVYTRRKVFRLADFIPIDEGSRMLVMGVAGEHRFLENRGFFELKDNYISYLQLDDRNCVDKVAGVIINPPPSSIMDAFYDARRYLENNEKVLMIIIPGLTNQVYSDALAKGGLPFLKNAGVALNASGVYPLEKQVWLGAIVSGKSPEENGITSVQDQELKAPTLFAVARQLKKPALLLQPAGRQLNTEIKALPVNDQNASGTADDELYTLSLNHLDQGYDLIMLCFEGIASRHKNQDEGAESTLAAVKAIDSYLQGIAGKWPGQIIITATPGTDTGESSRFDFNADTVFVPYWRFSP